VEAVAFSPDSKILASGAWDHSVKLWDVKSGKLLRTLIGEPRIPAVSFQVDCVAFSPDGKTIACGSIDKTIQMWDVGSGQKLHTMVHGSTADDSAVEVHSIAFSPNGKMLASGSENQSVNIWDAASGRLLKEIAGDDQIESVAFSNDGKTLAAGNNGKTIAIYDAASWHKLNTLSGHQDAVVSISFLPQNNELASGSRDGTIKLWNLSSGKQLISIINTTVPVPRSKSLLDSGDVATLVKATDQCPPVNCLAFSPDGAFLASGEGGTSGVAGNVIKLWDLNSWKQTRVSKPMKVRFTHLVFSGDGHRILGGCADGTVAVWNLKSGDQLSVVRTGTNDSFSGNLLGFVAFADPMHVIIGDDHGAGMYEIASGKRVSDVTKQTKCYSEGLSPDRTTLAAADALWSVKTGQRLAGIKFRHGDNEAATAAAYSIDSKLFVVATDAGMTYCFDSKTGQPLGTAFCGTEEINSIAISPDGKTIVCGGDDRTIHVCTNDGRSLKPFGKSRNPIAWLAFSPDGTKLAVADDSGTIQLRQAGSKNWTKRPKPASLLSAPKATIVAQSPAIIQKGGGADSKLSFSPDGKILAYVDCTHLRLWDVDSGKELKTIDPQVEKITAIAFSHDGTQIAAGSWLKKGVTVWDIASAKMLFGLQQDPCISEEVSSIDFSPRGDRLLVSIDTALYDGGHVSLWDFHSKQKLLELPRSLGPAKLSLDGTKIIAQVYPRGTTVFNAVSGTKLYDFGSMQVDCLSLSPDGTQLAVGHDGGMVCLYNLAGGKQVGTFPGHAGAVRSVTFSPNGKFLISGSEDSTIKFWNIASGHLAGTFKPPGQVMSLSISPDARHLASAGFDGTVAIWTLADPRQLAGVQGSTASANVAAH
jgi:WD40 repeat protein